jgi:hypothetical protein
VQASLEDARNAGEERSDRVESKLLVHEDTNEVEEEEVEDDSKESLPASSQ